MFSENDFGPVLATFCCYEHGTNASDAFRRSLQMKKTITNALRVLQFAEQTKYINQ